MHYLPRALALVAGLLSTAVHAEVTRGAVLSSTCFACHGTDGHSQGAIPSIYGIPAESLVAKMQAFKNDQALATVMNRHAKGYSDEEILLIAEHLSQLK
jgi:sulfide dehydrogenase cytochrome subunit